MRHLAFVLVLAACDGNKPVELVADPAATASAAAASVAIEKLGGKLERDEAAPGRPVIKIDLHGTAVTDADLRHVGAFPALRELDVRLTAISDAGMVHVKMLTELTKLNLFRTEVGDAGFAQLAPNLPKLETLLIGGTRITDAGIKHLVALPRLVRLSLFDTRITDAAIPDLAAMPRIAVVLVAKSAVTEAGQRALRQAKPAIVFTETT